jgi:hypothetical protein
VPVDVVEVADDVKPDDVAPDALDDGELELDDELVEWAGVSWTASPTRTPVAPKAPTAETAVVRRIRASHRSRRCGRVSPGMHHRMVPARKSRLNARWGVA